MLSGKSYTVAYVGTMGIPCRYGGFETFVDELATRLSGVGIRCIVYSSASSDETSTEPNENIEIRMTPHVGWPALDRILREAWPVIDLMFERVDIVHVMADSLFAPLWRLTGKKTVISLDGFEWKRGSYGLLTRIVVALGYALGFVFSDCVTADSISMVNWLNDRQGIQSTWIAYGARECNLRAESKAIEVLSRVGLISKGYFLFVGRLVPEKGIEMLVKAFRRHPDKILAVLGSDPFGGKFEKHLKSIATANVVFLGTVFGPEYDVVCSNSLAEIRPLLNDSEGINPASIEAMGFGLPIIASDVVINRETFGNSALFYEVGVDESLDRALARISSDEALRGELGVAARHRAHHEFSWSKWVGITQEVYESVLGRRR
jgi:glycosyltransferase involved in cell wall biosynthesis